ncbi:MAG: hypothetical protein Fur0041_05380 [Bacteroidia bacterium]
MDIRNFYNPGSVCPYCSGSPYIATAFRTQPLSAQIKGDAYFFALGNDNSSGLHGSWDMMYSTFQNSTESKRAISSRYAYKIKMDKWAIGVGGRVLAEQRKFGTLYHTNTAEPVALSGKKIWQGNIDLGVLGTNTHGTYFGFSVLHLLSNLNNLQYENIPQEQTGYYIISGTVLKANIWLDFLPEGTWRNTRTGQSWEGTVQMRFDHKWLLGTSYGTVNSGSNWAFRAGYTTPRFKWIAQIETYQGKAAVETGITWRLFPVECNAAPVKIQSYWNDFFPRN